jgi:hypothetical protein
MTMVLWNPPLNGRTSQTSSAIVGTDQVTGCVSTGLGTGHSLLGTSGAVPVMASP